MRMFRDTEEYGSALHVGRSNAMLMLRRRLTDGGNGALVQQIRKGGQMGSQAGLKFYICTCMHTELLAMSSWRVSSAGTSHTYRHTMPIASDTP